MELLLPLLQQAQKKDGYVSEKAMKEISKKTGIPISRIWGTATFYSMIYTKPQGKYIIEICNSPSCFLNKSTSLMEYLEQKLKIQSGETTQDKKFSLYVVSCIGCCQESPAMKINETVYGNLTTDKIDKILEECK